MRYDIKEFWFDEAPSGFELTVVIEENDLEEYDLFDIEVKPKPYNPTILYTGPNGAGNWHIVRFRKKEA